MIKLEIPLPPRVLNPNVKAHWATKYKASKKNGSDCFYLAKQIYPLFKEGSINISFEWYPKTKHSFDEDNAIASLKSSLDYIAKAWNVNDSRFKIKGLEKKDPVRGGKVVLCAWQE